MPLKEPVIPLDWPVKGWLAASSHVGSDAGHADR